MLQFTCYISLRNKTDKPLQIVTLLHREIQPVNSCQRKLKSQQNGNISKINFISFFCKCILKFSNVELLDFPHIPYIPYGTPYITIKREAFDGFDHRVGSSLASHKAIREYLRLYYIEINLVIFFMAKELAMKLVVTKFLVGKHSPSFLCGKQKILIFKF
jgi:hypothetical protein